MGIYATGQAYEQLILHLLGHPLPEARHYGGLILDAIKAVMPSFVARVERPERGGEWVRYLERRREAGERWAARLNLDRDDSAEDRPSVKLLHVDGDEDQLLAALLFEAAGVSEERTRDEVARLSAEDRAALLADLVGERANRRHRPGRGFEALRYRFEIVSDYGAFRDLQRHRMLTVQWQGLTPDLGAGIPDEVVEAGAGDSTHARSSARRRSTSGSPPPACATPPRTRSASASASATCSTSTRARRCTRSSCAPAARATRATARSRTRCTRRSPRTTRRSPRR